MGKESSSWWRSLLSCYGDSKVEDSGRTSSPPQNNNFTKTSTSPSRVSFSGAGGTPEELSLSLVGSNLYVFTLAELKAVTQNFSSSQLVGEGGFGPVYKGRVDDKLRPGLKAQTVAVKLLDLEGLQGHREWLAEVIFLGQLRHSHLVKLIGYCYEDEHRLLVYEFMTKGSLENHLFKRYMASLPWKIRLQIAVGAAKGLAFLHDAEKPVIYRDFKASNILLDSDFKAKLSDFGLAKDGPQGEDTHVSTRVMGTQGYAAPEYIMTGHLTSKSDVYSFGVVLLELLSGRRSVDKTRPNREQNLVEWARPWLNKEARRLVRIMDPTLDSQYSPKAAQKAAQLAAQCLNYHPKNRPTMSAVIEALEPLVHLDDDIPKEIGTFVYTAPPECNNSAAATAAAGNKANAAAAAAATDDSTSDEKKEENNKETNNNNGGRQYHHGHHHHHHNGQQLQQQRNPRSPLRSPAYTDTALYRNSPRGGGQHRGRGGL